MLRRFNPLRLSLEILLAIGLAELLVMLILPAVAPDLGAVAEGFADVTLLMLTAGPVVFWRCQVASRRTLQAPDIGQGALLDKRSVFAITGAAQLAALLLTAWVVNNQYHYLRDARQRQWENAAERMEAEIQRRFDRPVHGLRGLHSTYNTYGKLRRSQFRSWIEARDVLQQFPGIRGMGFIERVQREQLPAFLAAERADGAPDFQVRTSGTLPDLYVIKLIEPVSDNWQALGYDIGQEPSRRAAVEQAMDTGMPVLSAPIVLLQDQHRTLGFLYLLPQYAQDRDPQTTAQRQRAFVGAFYVPIVATELLEGVVKVGDDALDFSVSDLHHVSGTLLYSSTGKEHGEAADPVVRRNMLVGGRELSIAFYPTSDALGSEAQSGLIVLTLAGVLGSFLVALAAWLLASGRQRALAMAANMTQELDQLARVVRHTDNAVTLADRDMRIYWVNDGFTRMTGYALAEVRGKTPSEVLNSGKSDPAAIALLEDAVRLGQPTRAEVLNRSRDGREYWVDTEVQPTRGPNGELIGFMEIGTDISQKKAAQQQLEAALRDSEFLLSAVSLHAIVSVADRQGNIIDVNQAFCAVSGYSRQELLGANHRIVNSGAHPASFWNEMWATISAGNIWRSDICNRAKDGHLYWVDSLIAPFIGDDGLVEKYISIRTDITERLRSQALLEEMSSRMRLAVEGGSDGLWDWMDISKETQWWSPSYYSLLGYTPEEMPATVANYRALLHPDSLALSLREAQAAIAGERIFDIEVQLRTRDQGYRWFRTRAKVYRDAQGQAVRMAGATQDITERREQTRALNEAVERAQQASISKSQFLANMSHEIRTPMNAILGLLKLLQNTELTSRQGDYVGKTEGAARALLGLLNDILDFSKVEAGKMTLDPRPFRTDQLLRDLSVILSANVGQKDVEVLFDIDPDLPLGLVGDDMRLRQVLINLGGNAVKFTSAGEVVLRVRVLERSDADVLLEFAIKDSGIGIAPENQQHIFSGFSQAEANTTRRFGGTGLGLAISSRLTALLGGELQLQSALGQGSTFFFQLRMPLAPMDASVLERAQRLAQQPALQSLRILVADDNPVSRELMCKMLQSMDWEVDEATNGQEAVAQVQEGLLQARPYRVIFLDWQMPQMDGWQACRQIRDITDEAAGKMEPPVVVMVTAHGREMLAERSAKEQSMLNGFLVKPVTASMLLDTVTEALAAVELARQGRDPAAPLAVKLSRRLEGMRILVVEDNKINQMVAQGLLVQEGAEVTLADDGQLGVDAVAHTQPAFDVVLMDLQMPVMDGLAASRTIRGSLGMTTLPIVAMTANAMASDRAACLAAGMNDHVGKPFDLDELVATLLRHTGRSNLERPSTTPVSEVTVGQGPAVLDMDSALKRLGGNETVYMQALQAFAKELAATPGQLQTQLQDGAHPVAERTLHSLKGQAATLGAEALAAQAAALEKLLRAGAADLNAADVCSRLQAAIDTTLPAVQAVLAQAPLPASGGTLTSALNPGQKEALVRALQGLKAELLQSDMRAMETHARLRAEFDAQELERLDNAMMSLDFADAALACAELLAKLTAGPD